MIIKRYIIILAVAILVTSNIYPQYFGKNKVQYKVFNWSYIQSPNFDIYYYGEGKPLAEFTSEIAEAAYRQIAKYINWTLRKRVSIIIYNSHNDFQQTNVTYDYMPEGVGGVTELFKNRIVLPYEGSYEQFRHVIHHELVHAMINDMIYGGTYQAAVSSRVRVRIPLWMNEGLAEYLSTEWDTQADMIMRDIAVHDRIPDIRELDYYMAYKGGQSVWKFIAEKYGREKIGDIFHRVKRHQDIEKGFQKAVGLELKELSKQWQKKMKKEYWPDVAGREEIEDFAHRITNHEELKNYFNISPAISPDGSKIAIMTDRHGYADIYLISAIDGKPIKRLVKGNRTPEFEELKWLQPGLTWSPDGKRIAFAAKAGQSDALYLIDVKGKKRKKLVFNLDGIFTATWSPNGNEIAFVGNKGNSSDIYLYNLETGVLKNLTNDIFTDSEPAWSPDGRYIAFVSDRADKTDISPDFRMIGHNYRQTDIYILDKETGKILRVTDTPYNEDYPVWSNTTSTLAYTSDKHGVWNIYLIELDPESRFDLEISQSVEKPLLVSNSDTDENVAQQLVLDSSQIEAKAISNVLTGIFQLTWSKDDQKLYFSGYSDIGWDIYYITNPLELPEQTISKTNFFVSQEADSSDDFLFASAEETVDQKIIDYDATTDYSRYIFAPEYERYNLNLVDSTKSTPSRTTLAGDFKNPDGSFREKPYKTKFTLDLVNGQAYFSNVFGYIGTTVFAFSDILGDHRIFLGTELVVNLENSDYFFQYDYLRHRNDYSFSFYHTANFIGSQVNFIRLRHYNLDFSLSRPFSRFQRLEFGLTSHYINHKEFILKQSWGDEYFIIDRGTLRAFTYRFNWVYDNSTWGFTGPDDGWRGNLQFIQNPKFQKESIDFSTVLLDARRYFRITRDYSLAFRLMAGYSFGKDAQKFFLGGLENWLYGRGETHGKPDYGWYNEEELAIFDSLWTTNSTEYLQNVYFSIFALPVRGSRFIERVGTKMFLVNFEFRFPFVNYLALGFPLKVIFGNIRGVIFFDAGAAWDDQLNLTRKLPNKGKKEFDDLITGYGIGARINFGYFMLKIDSVWDLYLSGSSKPQYYFSLGTDI